MITPISFPGNNGFVTALVVLSLLSMAVMISYKQKLIAEQRLNQSLAAVVSMNLEKSNLKEIKGEMDEIN